MIAVLEEDAARSENKHHLRSFFGGSGDMEACCHSQACVVLIQVNVREDKATAPLQYSSGGTPQAQTSWKERLRAFFCCFAPDASEQYYSGGEAEAAVIRPPQPPTPPAYRGEPVIGPLHVRHLLGYPMQYSLHCLIIF
jgi:hypothetical protein